MPPQPIPTTAAPPERAPDPAYHARLAALRVRAPESLRERIRRELRAAARRATR